MTTTIDAAARQQQLLDLLGCPQCRRKLALSDVVRRDDGVSAADLMCPTHGRVGVIDQHRPSFLDRELETLAAGSNATRWTEIDVPAGAIHTAGRWWPIAEGWAGGADVGVMMSVSSRLRGVVFSVYRDEWSPVVELVVDGEVLDRVDLSEPGPGDLEVQLADSAERVVELRVVEPRAGGRLIVTATRLRVVAADCAPDPWGPVDRGNPYPQGFIDLLADAPESCVALDCGGGDRRTGDPRVFNLEYLPYVAPDLYGDGLALPFADDSFDLLLSQAVLEHVPDPIRATEEMRRILRPGGRIYCELAFTQPLHAVPSHYFNTTPHGASHLFDDWDIEVLDWFGGIGVTVEWWSQILDLESRWDPARLATLRELLREVDELTDHDHLQHFASGVLVVATKPADAG